MESTIRQSAWWRSIRHTVAVRIATVAVVCCAVIVAAAPARAGTPTNERTENFSYDDVNVELKILPPEQNPDLKGTYTFRMNVWLEGENFISIRAELPDVVAYMLDLGEDEISRINVPADIASDVLSLQVTAKCPEGQTIDRFKLAKQVLDRCGYVLKIKVPANITWLVNDDGPTPAKTPPGRQARVTRDYMHVEMGLNEVTDEELDQIESYDRGRTTVELVATDAERQTDPYRDAVKLLDGRYQRDDSVKPKYEVRRKPAAPSQD